MKNKPLESSYMMYEHSFQCPYCWENISMLFDQSAFGQSYVEDCEVCCQPIKVSCDFNDEGELTYFDAKSLDE